MSDYCVVVVDSVRARFFTLEPVEPGATEGGPNLREHPELANPDAELHDNAMWSNTKSGRNRAGGGGQAHGYDDHRDDHADEFRRRFARAVAQRAAELVGKSGSSNVVIAADKRMLGILRGELDPLMQTGVKVVDVAKDLGKLAAHELQRHLAKEGLVPERRNPER